MTADIAKLKVLAERVERDDFFTPFETSEALEAMGPLIARIEELEKERDLIKSDADALTKLFKQNPSALWARAEAAEKRVAELELTFTDERGTVWSPPTAEASQRVCVARNKWQSRADTLEAALRTIRDFPITNPDENQDAVNMHLIARKALGDQP